MIRVFVSSTFIDMKEEREALAKKVFPKIRAFAKERGQEFVEVDLRWGITREEVESGQTLRLCLEEIYKSVNSSSLFFIGLLGYRYGWIPRNVEEKIIKSLTEDKRFADLLKKYPVENTGITELEIRYGVLANPIFKKDKNKFALFYIRNIEISKKCFEKLNIKTDDNDINRAKKLVEEIKEFAKEYRDRVIVREYSKVDELVNYAEEDLKRVIENLYPKEEVDQFAKEKQLHQLFAKSRLKVYVPEVDALNALTEFMKNFHSGYALIKGKSGIGKSSFLAYFSEEIKKEAKDILIIEHYTTAHKEAAHYENILVRFIRELEVSLNLQNGFVEEKPKKLLMSTQRKKSIGKLKDSEERLKDKFIELLSEVTRAKKVYIILDGVDHIEPREKRRLTWLPDSLPDGSYVLLSIRLDTNELGYLEKCKKPFVIELKGLQKSEDKKRIIVEYYKPYGKKLESEYIEEIINTDKTKSPLFLKAVLEELRVYGDYETLGKRVKGLLNLNEVEIFENIFERCERDYGDYVKDLLCLITLSKDGVTEQELLDLLREKKVMRTHLSTFLYALEGYFIEIQGRLKPAHSQIEKAIKHRYLKDEKSVTEYRNKIISIFEKYSKHIEEQSDYVDFDRVLGELMYQAFFLRDYERLFHYMSRDKAIVYLLRQENKSEFYHYIKALKNENLVKEWLNRVSDLRDLRKKVMYFLRDEFLDEAIYLGIKIVKDLEELYHQDKKRWMEDYAWSLKELGIAYARRYREYSRNEYLSKEYVDNAIKYLEKSYNIYKELYLQDKLQSSATYAYFLNELATEYLINDIDINKAVELYEESVAIFEILYNNDKAMWNEAIVLSLSNLTTAYIMIGNLGKAFEKFDKLLSIVEKSTWRDKQKLSKYLVHLFHELGVKYAEIGLETGKIEYLDKAIELLIKFLEIYEELYECDKQSWNLEYTSVLLMLGDIYLNKGSKDKANEFYEMFIKVNEELYQLEEQRKTKYINFSDSEYIDQETKKYIKEYLNKDLRIEYTITIVNRFLNKMLEYLAKLKLDNAVYYMEKAFTVLENTFKFYLQNKKIPPNDLIEFTKDIFEYIDNKTSEFDINEINIVYILSNFPSILKLYHKPCNRYN